LKAVQAAATAEGGELPEWPPLVSANPNSISLVDESEATLTLTNEGGGQPSVVGISTDPAWLSVQVEAVDEQGLGDYRVNADRSELADGFYQGQLIFTLDDSTELTVSVYLQQGAASSEGE